MKCDICFLDRSLGNPSGEKYRFNVISLEFSKTELKNDVSQPSICSGDQSICWSHLPSVDPEWKPEMLHYCLLGTEGCYTDWHIDFGGTSAWIHMIYGAKLFILIEPSEANLIKFEHWENLEPNKKRRTGFIQYCEGIKEPIPPNSIARIELTTGETILMPAGWIHCVITTMGSLAFGGNFFHYNCAKMQIRIKQLENNLKMSKEDSKKYKFDGFDRLNWYALRELGTELIEHAEACGKGVPSKTLIQRFGIKKFEAITILIEYLQDKTNNEDDIPDNVEFSPSPLGFIKNLKGLIYNYFFC